MEHLLLTATEMDFDVSNLVDAWAKWKQTMQLYWLECCHEAEERRRKILSVPFHNRRKRKINLQHMVMRKEVR